MNSTYTGILRILQQKLASFSLSPHGNGKLRFSLFFLNASFISTHSSNGCFPKHSTESVQFIEEDFIEIDQPCTTEEFVILQELNPSKSRALISSILDSLTFDRYFLFCVVLFFLVICVALHFWKVNKLKAGDPPVERTGRIGEIRGTRRTRRTRCTTKQTKRWIRLRTLSNIRLNFAYTLSAFGIFLLFYDFHLFFAKLLISNNIQAEKGNPNFFL